MFVRALAKDEGDALAALESYLLERGWPDDHQFEMAFVEFPLYQRGYTREIRRPSSGHGSTRNPPVWTTPRSSM